MAGPAPPGDPAAGATEDWEGLRGYALGFPGAHEDHPWGETVLIGLLRDWIAESYCAVAPKTLVKQ